VAKALLPFFKQKRLSSHLFDETVPDIAKYLSALFNRFSVACMSLIGSYQGFFWETFWSDANMYLREAYYDFSGAILLCLSIFSRDIDSILSVFS
jgi:hypothetical protein